MRNAVARGEEQYELQMRGADDGQIRAEHVADLWQKSETAQHFPNLRISLHVHIQTDKLMGQKLLF